MQRTTSRRAVLLSGIATAPALAAPALALTGPGRKLDLPAFFNAELATLETRIMRAAHEAEISGAAHTRAEEVIWAWRKENPSPKFPKCKNEEAEQIVQRIVSAAQGEGDLSSEIATLKGLHLDDDCRATLREYHEWMAADRQWNERKKVAEADCRLDELNDKFSAHCSELWDLAEEISDIPALNIEGVKIKRRIARYRTGTIELDTEDMITDSIKRDLRLQRKLAARS
jgi:hypothetical protein